MTILCTLPRTRDKATSFQAALHGVRPSGPAGPPSHQLPSPTQNSRSGSTSDEPTPSGCDYARLAAEGYFSVPVARVFPLEDWRAAVELSLSGKPGRKVILQPYRAIS